MHRQAHAPEPDQLLANVRRARAGYAVAREEAEAAKAEAARNLELVIAAQGEAEALQEQRLSLLEDGGQPTERRIRDLRSKEQEAAAFAQDLGEIGKTLGKRLLAAEAVAAEAGQDLEAVQEAALATYAASLEVPAINAAADALAAFVAVATRHAERAHPGPLADYANHRARTVARVLAKVGAHLEKIGPGRAEYHDPVADELLRTVTSAYRAKSLGQKHRANFENQRRGSAAA